MCVCPLAYDAAVEQPAPEEAEAVASIHRRMHGIPETTWADCGHSVRSVHAKSHGLLQGEIQVLTGLPASFAQGVFARPGTFPVVMRFSINPGDILDDTVSSPRRLAIKVIGVEGDRMPGSEGDMTQDFVMVNGRVFVALDAAGFNRSLGLLAATTDTGQGWKKGAVEGAAGGGDGAVGRPVAGWRAEGAGRPAAHASVGRNVIHPNAFRYGLGIAKLFIAPVSPALKALTDAPVDMSAQPNGLRAALIDHFSVHGSEWELRVQLRTNADSMSVEDASVPWPEDESAYVPMARITVTRQPAWNEDRAQQIDDGLSFSPWHGITAHQLGSINRARKSAYAMSAGFRAAHNRCPIHEPRGALELSAQAPSVYGRAPGREGHRPNTPDALPGTLGQPPLTRDKPSSIVQHGMFHLLFGVTTAVVADRVARHIRFRSLQLRVAPPPPTSVYAG